MTLGGMIEALTADDGRAPRLDPGAARGLGVALGRFIWGDHSPGDLSELWIHTTDPFIASLPWALTRPPGSAQLAAQGCPVAVRIGEELPEAGLFHRPRILVCAPNPKGWGGTDVTRHLADLREALGDRMLDILPKTLAELKAALSGLQPEILYFYGHGELVGAESLNLVMQMDADRLLGADLLRIDSFASWLKNTAPLVLERLGVVYLNCCWGGTAVSGGAPLHLGPILPALISNRTSALIPAARAQAVELLRLIAIDAVAPHEAVSMVATESSSLPDWSSGLEAGPDEPWWMTPVAYARYRKWLEPFQLKTGRLRITERQTLRLARKPHLDTVLNHLKPERLPPVSLLLWYGTPEDGLEPLADRIRMDLPELRSLFHAAIEWPREGLHEGTTAEELARLIVAQMQSAAGVEEGDANGVAQAASRRLGPRGGRALIRFEPVPGDLPADRLAVYIGAAQKALREAVALPMDQVFKTRSARVVALLPVVASVSDGDLPENVEAMAVTTIWVASQFLPTLDPVHRSEVQSFLTNFQERIDATGRSLAGLAREIHSRTDGRYQSVRQALQAYDFL